MSKIWVKVTLFGDVYCCTVLVAHKLRTKSSKLCKILNNVVMFIIVAHKLRTKSLILKSPSTLLTFCPEPKTLQITKKWYCKYYFSKKQIIIEIITTLNSSILRSWQATFFNCATSDNATTETAFMFRLRLHSKKAGFGTLFTVNVVNTFLALQTVTDCRKRVVSCAL